MALENKIKFSGLSTPEDLIEVWKELKRDDDPMDMRVIWDYTSPKQLRPGFNIINCLYSPQHPDETGHYCLIYVDKHTKSVMFYNPVGKYSDLPEIKEILADLVNEFEKNREWPKENITIDLSGKQRASSENCGYHCLAKAFNIYLNNEGINSRLNSSHKGGANPKASESAEDLLYAILKNVRGIYFGMRDGWQDSTRARPKHKGASNAGSGLADVVKHQKYTYSDLKSMLN